MELTGARVIVTGAASGLGAALARGLVDRGAQAVSLWDRDREGLDRTAGEIGELASTCVVDLTDSAAIQHGLAASRTALSGIDMVFANAGVITLSDLATNASDWDLSWKLHVTSVMELVQGVLPDMLERGTGHIATTASSTAMTLNPKSIVYSVTKRAQHAMMEWLQGRYADSGVGFTTFLPGGISTPLHARMSLGDPHSQVSASEADSPDRAAAVFLDGITAGQPIVYSKDRTLHDLQRRAQDYGGWLEDLARRFPDATES